MAAEITITYFMEDAAHEAFITSIVKRIAIEAGINEPLSEVRNARGGYRMLGKLKEYMKEYKELLWGPDRILVVVRDANCIAYNARLKELKAPIAEYGLGSDDRIAFALPDPHIERWYVVDQRAFNEVIGPNAAPPMPRNKCGRIYWKSILNKALQAAGINSRGGGSEYGGPIAVAVNISDLEKADDSFKRFADDLRRAFKQLQRPGE